jgi:2-polyprenyl-3-methyl-5-hydroxy-6-metoxy-1,4-benzoquinol methylase
VNRSGNRLIRDSTEHRDIRRVVFGRFQSPNLKPELSEHRCAMRAISGKLVTAPPAACNLESRSVDPETRAILSGGTSSRDIYDMVLENIPLAQHPEGTLLDVGCGSGALRDYVKPICDRYVGADLIRYPSFPLDCEFYPADFNSGSLPLSDDFADMVVAVEVIEHVENPRALMRELVRVAKPRGHVIVTTPNQLSLLSFLTLAIKHRFAAFQDMHYPAHLTALLEIDLLRIAWEAGLENPVIKYSGRGRIPKTARHYPRAFSRLWPRAFSDNVMMIARKSSLPVSGPSSSP